LDLHLQTDISRKADQSKHLVIGIQNREFGGKAPDWLEGPVPLHFKVIYDWLARPQDFAVLVGGNPTKITWADFAWELSDSILLSR
jgi:hypothetical protein